MTSLIAVVALRTGKIIKNGVVFLKEEKIFYNYKFYKFYKKYKFSSQSSETVHKVAKLKFNYTDEKLTFLKGLGKNLY